LQHDARSSDEAAVRHELEILRREVAELEGRCARYQETVDALTRGIAILRAGNAALADQNTRSQRRDRDPSEPFSVSAQRPPS
jgi:hypothetical protein